MKQKQTTILSSGRPSSWKQKTTEAGMKSMTYRTGDPNRYFVVVEREREGDWTLLHKDEDKDLGTNADR